MLRLTEQKTKRSLTIAKADHCATRACVLSGCRHNICVSHEADHCPVPSVLVLFYLASQGAAGFLACTYISKPRAALMSGDHRSLYLIRNTYGIASTCRHGREKKQKTQKKHRQAAYALLYIQFQASIVARLMRKVARRALFVGVEQQQRRCIVEMESARTALKLLVLYGLLGSVAPYLSMQTVPPPHKSFCWRHQRPRERESVLPYPFPRIPAQCADATLPPGDTEAVRSHVVRSAALRCLTAVCDPGGPRGNISSTMYKRKWLVSAVIPRRRRAGFSAKT